MVRINGETYYTVADVVQAAGGTLENARRHCRIVARSRPEWHHSHLCWHKMNRDQFTAVLDRMAQTKRKTRKPPT